MNIGEIVTVLSELHKITGMRISLHGQDFKEIAAYPESALPFCAKIHESASELVLCAGCDAAACRAALTQGKTYIYKCRYGLTEAVSPLYNFGVLTGFLMMGQIADSPSAAEDAVRMLEKSQAATDTSGLKENIAVINPDMLSSYVKIMTICAQYLTLSNALPSVKPTTAELAKKYINENLSEKFNISDICRNLGCSKSTLLTSFKRRFGVTVNSYVTDLRLELSCKLLNSGEKTVNEVATECGFSDQSYFSKVFSAKYGIPPSEYRHKDEAQAGKGV